MMMIKTLYTEGFLVFLPPTKKGNGNRRAVIGERTSIIDDDGVHYGNNANMNSLLLLLYRIPYSTYLLTFPLLL